MTRIVRRLSVFVLSLSMCGQVRHPCIELQWKVPKEWLS